MIRETKTRCCDLGFIQGVVHMKVHERPVVEPSTPHGVIVNAKAQGFNQMERATGRNAQPGDIACIRWNFRLH